MKPSFQPLHPVSFLARAAAVHRDATALVDGDLELTYAELWERTRRLAGALRTHGVGPGDRVAVLATNSHVLLEAHYGVPLAGAVLVALNMRLSRSELTALVEHSGARVLLCDTDMEEHARAVADAAAGDVLVLAEGGAYDEAVASGEPLAEPLDDERGLLSINYTSGTTGTPKGVMYHPRGAYLQALAMAYHSRLGAGDVFLWTLPMFHCNGWCFTWAVTAAGATHLCLREVEPGRIWSLVRERGVTHFNAAPTVLTALAHHEDAAAVEGERAIRVATGGAPPSPALLGRLEELGMEVTHLYGLTETFGPVIVCEWKSEWDGRPDEERAQLKARQGVANVIAEAARVVGEDGEPVAADGEALGEVLLRGNDVMLGYYEDEPATAEALVDGWFHTGDLAVVHPDGYLELRDRSKDVIVSGGENIASVEVEQALASHPAVMEAAVVPAPDERWGEHPAAYVILVPGEQAGEEELVEHARGLIARFKAPREVHFREELPKTSTGKIQKHLLREELWEGRERRVG